MGGRRSPKLQLQFLHLPCLQETEFCGRNGLFCPTSSDGRSPVPKITTAVFTFALFTGNGILWKDCVVCPPPLVMGRSPVPKVTTAVFYICPVYRKRNFVEGMCCFAPPLVMGGRRSPKLQLQFFTFALFTGNVILWKECVVLPHL
ncbi:hypothetical protein TNCV_4633411 [Trichonephila clavipes]|nr:hypothetical protein TNCV_4633411 [Trichonephila clavipes]